jgi:hypothetical protein
MEIKLIGRIQSSRIHKNSWRYEIIDSDYRESFPIFEPPSSPERLERWREILLGNGDEETKRDNEIAKGVALNHTPDELALMRYELYQSIKFYELNEELGLERVSYQRNEEEFAKLKKEMELKREEIIRDEEYLEITEAIRNLFKEKTSQPPTNTSDYPSLFTIGLSLLILSIFGFVLLCFSNWINKNQVYHFANEKSN